MNIAFYGINNGAETQIPSQSGVKFVQNSLKESIPVGQYQNNTYLYDGVNYGIALNNNKYESASTVYKNGASSSITGIVYNEANIRLNITHTSPIKVDNIKCVASGNMSGLTIQAVEVVPRPQVTKFSVNLNVTTPLSLDDSFTTLNSASKSDESGSSIFSFYHGDNIGIFLSGTLLDTWVYDSGTLVVAGNKKTSIKPQHMIVNNATNPTIFSFALNNDFCNSTISGINPSYYSGGIRFMSIKSSGNSNWTGIDNTNTLTLSNSPGSGNVAGTTSLINNERTGHDWRLALSVSPQSDGTLTNYGIRCPFEYYIPSHQNTIHLLDFNGASAGAFVLRFGNNTNVNIDVVTENDPDTIKTKYQTLYNLSASDLIVGQLGSTYSIEFQGVASNMMWGKARVLQNTADALPEISFVQRGF